MMKTNVPSSSSAMVYAVSDACTDTQLVSIWLAGKSKTSQNTYASHIKQFLEYVGKPLKELKLEDMQLWVSSLENSQRYKTATLKLKINTVKSLLTFGQKVGYLQFNIGSAVKPPNPKNELSSRMLSETEVTTLIEKANQNQRDRIILKLMYVCGMRVSEVVGLNWRDLVPNNNGGLAIVLGKGGKTRVVLIPEKLWLDIQQLPKTDDAVFISRKKNRISRKTVHYMIKQYAKQAGINGNVSPHWLRHSHATHSIERGCNLHLLQQSLGHSNLSITSRYLHARPNEGSSQFIQDI
ncbi:integrase family protein [Gloeothece citriformis PCC 7424]|uniref:Integrase family protein n=1 Tax=Gloeothece citriformis (strain PCC 7424) TaxID=65393 RepID=B7KE90_GLOC7|nr:tyrosine-type recombinase/integrase [Gloeothece citriformis]ACK73208.1 integrase family protein [Gloeothece citriformis PCC 7424]